MSTIITDAEISIGAVDLSAYVQRVEIKESYDEVDATTMGSGGARERDAGLSDGSVSISFFQSWEANAVNATIRPLMGTKAAILVKSSGAGATSATNPQYSFDALINDFTPLSAAVGEAAMADVTWPISGGITEITT